MATNDNKLHYEIGAPIQQMGVLQLQSQDALLAQNKIISQQLEEVTKKLSLLPQEIYDISMVQKQWKQWKPQITPYEKTTKFEDTFQQFMKMSVSCCKNVEAAFNSMKMHIGQMFNKMEGCKKDPKSNLSEECKTIITRSGELEVGKALIDLGASINLMSLSMFKRIEGLELKPTRMALQLADMSLKYPYGVVEDVLVKVDKFVFLVDFVIMEMEENGDVPLILGRPFIKTA
ncbi:uncharacterized protein LOC124840911 [Vigna umbellata]|uniref:uncharacterized protein LOC124840911 n=1 Tax=Vigna umbellata TaxID=87088 RepID=UPI001F5F099B|nr:uncharacterized protein LOC124840911 [Vigna umbellata]